MEVKNFYNYFSNTYDLKSKTNQILENIEFRFFQIRSPQDSRLHVVKDDLPQETVSQPISAFDQLNLFDNSNDIMKRMVNQILFCDLFRTNIFSLERT